MDNKLTIKNNSKSRRGFLGDITKWIGGTALLAATANVFTSNKVKADTTSANSLDPFFGEIMMVGFNFAPRSWALCDGQLQAISQNTALFSLLGTTFGGDGRITFGLPDLRGRYAAHVGTGPGLSQMSWGEKAGSENVTLNVNQIPTHNHSATMNVISDGGTSDNPVNNYMASNSEGVKHYSDGIGLSTDTANANSIAIGNNGANQSHTNMPPYLGIYHVIALQGVFPSRN